MKNIPKGKIVISKFLKSQIDFFHSKIKNMEWSGILLYKQTGGDFSTLKDLEFFAIGMYLMDKGSSVWTEFKVNEGIAKAYKYLKDDNLEYLNGLIHSHHNMQAFFSGADISELEENAPNYNFYLSLIVNMEGTYAAKLAIPSKDEKIIVKKIKDANGVEHTFRIKEKSTDIIYVDLNIEFEGGITIPEWVKENLEEVETNYTSKQKESVYPFVSRDPAYSSSNYRGYISDYKTHHSHKNRYEPVQQSLWDVDDTPEDDYMDNSYTTNQRKINEYAIKLITLDDIIDTYIDKSVFDSTSSAKFKSLISENLPKNPREWKEYEDMLVSNIEIIHENVFGNTDAIVENIIRIIDIFSSLSEEIPNLKRVVEILNNEIKEYGILY